MFQFLGQKYKWFLESAFQNKWAEDNLPIDIFFYRGPVIKTSILHQNLVWAQNSVFTFMLRGCGEKVVIKYLLSLGHYMYYTLKNAGLFLPGAE